MRTIIKTERLYLRTLTEADVEIYHVGATLCGRPHNLLVYFVSNMQKVLALFVIMRYYEHCGDNI